MAGLHSQSRRKGEKRSVDMSAPETDAAVQWIKPPPEECDEDPAWTIAPTGADPGQCRIKIRIVSHTQTHAIVEFALVLQVFDRGKWRDVASVDSCHDVDVHLHRYARSTDDRIGEPEVLTLVTCEADVQDGYNVAYDMLEGSWAEHQARWHDA